RMPSGEISLGNRFVGNLGPMADYNCLQTGIQYSHNVWLSAKCGPTDKRVKSLGFVNPESLDLHLLATSPAIGAGDSADRPSTNIDAQARPLRAAPDAGADQREPGAIVPGRSIGSVRVDMTTSAVIALYGNPTRVLQLCSAS